VRCDAERTNDRAPHITENASGHRDGLLRPLPETTAESQKGSPRLDRRARSEVYDTREELTVLDMMIRIRNEPGGLSFRQPDNPGAPGLTALRPILADGLPLSRNP